MSQGHVTITCSLLLVTAMSGYNLWSYPAELVTLRLPQVSFHVSKGSHSSFMVLHMFCTLKHVPHHHPHTAFLHYPCYPLAAISAMFPSLRLFQTLLVRLLLITSTTGKPVMSYFQLLCHTIPSAISLVLFPFHLPCHAFSFTIPCHSMFPWNSLCHTVPWLLLLPLHCHPLAILLPLPPWHFPSTIPCHPISLLLTCHPILCPIPLPLQLPGYSLCHLFAMVLLCQSLHWTIPIASAAIISCLIIPLPIPSTIFFPLLFPLLLCFFATSTPPSLYLALFPFSLSLLPLLLLCHSFCHSL